MLPQSNKHTCIHASGDVHLYVFRYSGQTNLKCTADSEYCSNRGALVWGLLYWFSQHACLDSLNRKAISLSSAWIRVNQQRCHIQGNNGLLWKDSLHLHKILKSFSCLGVAACDITGGRLFMAVGILRTCYVLGALEGMAGACSSTSDSVLSLSYSSSACDILMSLCYVTKVTVITIAFASLTLFYLTHNLLYVGATVSFHTM